MPRRAALALCAAALAVHAAAAPRPNLIFIITDDQDILLNGTSAMPALAAEMVAGGMSLRGFVDVPVCCPSRTSTLAGRYSHNLNNTEMGWCGNFLDAHVNRTWVKDLKDAGYSTALFGKYFNDYSSFCHAKAFVPLDWSFFNAMCDDNNYFGNSFNVNGTMKTVGPDVYLTNVIGNASLAWLADAAAAAAVGGAPFFAYIAPHAPHVPATPAHEYENAPLASETAPRVPSWNYGTQHHHWLVSEKAPLSPALVNFSDQLFARRLRATMSVDDIVAAVYALLRKTGMIQNTYVVYSSDHGYDLGNFRLPSGKFNAFENDIRVPFHVTGPGVPAGVDRPEILVNNVDLAPTLLGLAGVAPTTALDGRSFAPHLAAQTSAPQRDRLVFEYWGMGYTMRGPCKNGTTPCPNGPEALEDAPSNSWSGLRILNATHDLVYAEYRPSAKTPLLRENTNFTVAYNMSSDPWQLVNRANASRAGSFSAEMLAALSNELWAVATCEGGACP